MAAGDDAPASNGGSSSIRWRLYAGSGPATFFVRYGYTFYAYNDDTRGANYAFSSAPDGGPPSGYCRYGQYAWSRAYSYSSSRYGKSL
ncbi:hypothetical protein SPI_03403 [Niveomyces insectorum RCEF 264]|uniref:Uncharacterized protein n=1 Tax=Niveomyces insectorum RCEF 264 TaxID=1081102 RepID=A0A167XB87_9HYPO|nr:hypothetical protein SPI_03403 [Niveomyces insectorum RCEF 264]